MKARLLILMKIFQISQLHDLYYSVLLMPERLFAPALVIIVRPAKIINDLLKARKILIFKAILLIFL